MPNTFDARIAQYSKMLDDIHALQELETSSQFRDATLIEAEKSFKEHIEALRLGRKITLEHPGHEFDVEKELSKAKKTVYLLEILRALRMSEPAQWEPAQ